VIAFSDPNDILSYPIPDFAYLVDEKKSRFNSVTLPIAKWAVLGVFASPLQAHTGYWDDATVIGLVTNGKK
jgi:hypothetical protein